MTSLNVTDKLERLSVLLKRGRYRLGDEGWCQQDIGSWLNKNGVIFKREFVLNQGRVDFFLPKSGIAIEVKVSKQWQKMAVFRQCEGYCRDSRVLGLLLATGASQGLPLEIEGKPARVLKLSETAL